MTTRTRVVAYLDPALLENVKALALRRNDSKAPVASFLSGDATDKDPTELGETVPPFVHYERETNRPCRRLKKLAVREGQ